MKWIKDNWLIIVIVVVVCIVLLYLGKCSAQKDIEGIVKMNEAGTKALEQVITDLEKVRTGIEASIKEHNENQAAILAKIERADAGVAEIRQRIGNLPSKEVFTDVAKANLEYSKLLVTATAQGQLILTYEAQITDYKLFVQAANAKEQEWLKLKANLESEIGTHKSKIELDQALIEALKKTHRPDIIVPFAGVYWDPVRQRGGFSVGFGFNLKPAWKLVKGIF